MRSNRFNTALAMLIAAFLVPGMTRAEPWKAIPTELRVPDMPIPLVVHLTQSELYIGDDPGFEAVTTAAPGGLVGALIVGAAMSGGQKKARARLEPILSSLGEYDAATPLMAGIKRGLAGRNWLSLSGIAPLRDNSSPAKSALLDQVEVNYLANADCTYLIGREFQALYVRCQVQVAVKNGTSGALGETRWNPKRLMLDRAVETEVELDVSTASPPGLNCYKRVNNDRCRALWQANSDELLRLELSSALERTGELVGQELSLTSDEIDAGQAAKDQRVKFFGHEGAAIKGAENIEAPYSGNFFINRAAKVKPDADGVLIMEDKGNLYHKRVKAAR